MTDPSTDTYTALINAFGQLKIETTRNGIILCNGPSGKTVEKNRDRVRPLMLIII